MNFEERLRDAFDQRAGAVEVSPGALFDIQRRLDGRRRLPELRLRPALVLAAAACAAVAVVVSVSLSRTAPDPGGEIATPVASVGGTDTVAPLSPSTPTTAGPQPPPITEPAPAAGTDAATPQDGAGQIASATPPSPPPTAAPPSPPPAAAADPPTTTEPPVASEDPVIAAEEPATPACAAEPAGSGDQTTWVTVYFACGENDAAPRRRAVTDSSLAAALAVLLNGPNEADAAEGFRGLPAGPGRTAWPAADDRWVTIDLPAGVAEAFSAAETFSAAEITAEQFLAQLNATVFEFPDFVVAEYRLDGDCAAFGRLLGRSCEVYTSYGGRHISKLTAHTIGATEPVVRAEPSDGTAALDILADGTRITDRRVGDNAWAEVITTAGTLGWVSTETLVAQPLLLDGEDAAAMASLARRLTTGPELGSSSFRPAGLVLRWGADSNDFGLVPTAGASVGGAWWNGPLDAPSPRDGSTTASLAELLWIDGASGSATVTVNAPGPLGEPHPDFAALPYVSIYQPALGASALPPRLALPPEPTTTTTEAADPDDLDLPPPLPGLLEDEEDTAAEEPPTPLSAQVSVVFDFLSPGGPRIAAVEAIWVEP
ncbi:MAG: hypothetical protein OXG52_01040 [bacterium]|nr:hypothetical protein [bacterium]